MDFRLVFYVIGLLLSILAAGMFVPLLIDLHAGHDDWKVFFFCICITAFVGGSLVLSNRGGPSHFTVRHGFILTVASWVAIIAFSALPLWMSSLNLSYTDAFFEATSAVTTTGSTVIVGLNDAPPGILMWRAILQSLGGIGFIVMAMIILPFLKVGGMQLFQTESSDKTEKAMPRIRQQTAAIGSIYIVLTVACALAYWLAGMNGFDAICHAMTTLATGGLANYDESFAFFKSASLEWISVAFMLAGAAPFIMYIKLFKGDILAPFRNAQFMTMMKFVIGSILVMAVWHAHYNHLDFLEALRPVAFNMVSVITTTGFTTTDYNGWGSFAVVGFFFLTFVGGCTGSTSGGIKIMRFQIMAEVMKRHILRLTHPHATYSLRYEGHAITEDIPYSVMVFIFVLLISVAVFSLCLAFMGIDFLTSVSAVAACITNVGPGLGSIVGPVGNFSSLPDNAKWVLSLAMLMGRLELLTLLALLSPRLWRG